MACRALLLWLIVGIVIAEDESGLYARLTDIDVSVPGNHVGLVFQIDCYGMNALKNDALRCPGVHLQWRKVDRIVLDEDVWMDPPLTIDKERPQQSATWTARLPIEDGDYTLKATPAWLHIQEVSPVPRLKPTGLRAIPRQRLIRTGVSVRGKGPSIGKNLIILDGTLSEPQDNELVYAWKQTGGDSLKLSPANLNKDRIGLYIFKEGIYKFEVTVTDGNTVSVPAEVTVVVGEPQTSITLRRHPNALFWFAGAVLALGAAIALLLRRWIRFHLSTSVAMLLAAGGMLALNSRENLSLLSSPFRIFSSPGWPWPFLQAPEFETWNLSTLLQDAAIFLAAIAFIAAAMELLFKRRRETK